MPASDAGGAYRAAPELLLRRWPAEATAIAFDGRTGSTHLIAGMACELLQAAGSRPFSAAALADWLRDHLSPEAAAADRTDAAAELDADAAAGDLPPSALVRGLLQAGLLQQVR